MPERRRHRLRRKHRLEQPRLQRRDRLVDFNGTVYDFELGTADHKDQCKNGGWQNFTDPPFKNQGDCVSYVATGGKNGANG